jgi:serine/threonine protein kinase
MLHKIKPLSISEKLLITQCLVERRSKGKLYIAIDRITGEKCSLRKIFLDVTNAGQDDGLPTSILREISHLKSIEHPNIVKLKHAEVTNELTQIVYEYYDHNLKEYMRKYSKPTLPAMSSGKGGKLERPIHSLAPDTIKNLMYQILQGLCYCHRNGVMHRNLKPDNIMITADNTIKLGDFSLSRIAQIPHFPYTPEDPKERERSGREARRLWYRPPEMLFRKKYYSFEVDMWAVGCLLAELALGEPLFNGETEIE